MQRGRKAGNPALKELSGTFRADRHADIVSLQGDAAALNPPTQPDYLTPEAQIVWSEELERVVAIGATDADSSMFARYCEIEAAFRVLIMAGSAPTAVMMTELRKMAELLGIAGVKSRLTKLAQTKEAKPSPFTIRPTPITK